MSPSGQRLRVAHGREALQLQSLCRIPAEAVGCHPCGESLWRIPMENPYRRCRLARFLTLNAPASSLIGMVRL